MSTTRKRVVDETLHILQISFSFEPPSWDIYFKVDDKEPVWYVDFRKGIDSGSTPYSVAESFIRSWKEAGV